MAEGRAVSLSNGRSTTSGQMVTKLKRDPLAPLLRLLGSVQDNESYFWDTTLGYLVDFLG
jgi:hypothetical protein